MEKKMPLCYAVVIFFVVCEIAAENVYTPLGTFKSNCFSFDRTSSQNNCESAIIEVYGIKYGCEMVIDLNFIIHRIGLVDNRTLLYGDDSQTYAIDEIKEEARLVDELFPPLKNMVDINNNMYFVQNGFNYVLLNSTGEIKEIKTGSKSFNQLAMNVDGKTLLILKPRENERKNADNTGGDLYVLKLALNSSHMARLDTAAKHITAISTLNGKLLFGLKTGYDTGKLIRLIRIPDKADPCNLKIQKGITNLHEKYIEILADLCEDSASNLAESRPFYNDTLKSLTAENIALKIKLDEAQVNCNTRENPNSKTINTDSRHTRDASPEDDIDIVYGSPPKLNRSRREEVEECPPTYKIQLENGNLKARLRIMTNKFKNLISSIDALNSEFEKKPVPAVEEVESNEPVYRIPKKCLEVYELNALTNSIERLEQEEKDLRLKLSEYTDDTYKIYNDIVDEEYLQTEEEEASDEE